MLETLIAFDREGAVMLRSAWDVRMDALEERARRERVAAERVARLVARTGGCAGCGRVCPLVPASNGERVCGCCLADVIGDLYHSARCEVCG